MATKVNSYYKVNPLLKKATPYSIEQKDLDKFTIMGDSIKIEADYLEWLKNKIKQESQVIFSRIGCDDRYYLKYKLPNQSTSGTTYFSCTDKSPISYGKIK